MALDNALRALRLQLEHVRDTVGSTRITLVEDRPGDVALVDHRRDVIDDLLGWLNEAVESAQHGEGAASQRAAPGGTHKVQRSLAHCHERVNRVNTTIADDLLSYERLAEMADLGRSRGAAWQAWARGVRDAIRQSQQLVLDVNSALLTCWRELAERAGAQGVHIRASSVGQRITVSDGSQPSARDPG